MTTWEGHQDKDLQRHPTILVYNCNYFPKKEEQFMYGTRIYKVVSAIYDVDADIYRTAIEIMGKND